jgi:hypothetical protein
VALRVGACLHWHGNNVEGNPVKIRITRARSQVEALASGLLDFADPESRSPAPFTRPQEFLLNSRSHCAQVCPDLDNPDDECVDDS